MSSQGDYKGNESWRKKHPELIDQDVPTEDGGDKMTKEEIVATALVGMIWALVLVAVMVAIESGVFTD